MLIADRIAFHCLSLSRSLNRVFAETDALLLGGDVDFLSRFTDIDLTVVHFLSSRPQNTYLQKLQNTNHPHVLRYTGVFVFFTVW